MVSSLAIIGLPTTIVAVAVSQFDGTAPVSHNWYTILYVPETVFGAKVNTPLASILRGPVVIGVTSVFDPVTATPFRVSLSVTLPTVVAVVAVTWVL